MQASFGEPFLLSSYSQSSKFTYSKNVYAIFGHSLTKSQGYLCLVAQGDGVHVLDLADPHPVLSYSSGPSTSFSCPPLLKETEPNVFTTYAAVDSSPDITTRPPKSTIWIWHESTTESLSERAAQKRKSAQVPHPVAQLASVPGFDSVILVSPEGHVTVASPDLGVQTTLDAPAKRSLRKSFVYDRRQARFVPTIALDGAIVVLFEDEGDEVHVRVCGAPSEGPIASLGDVVVPVSAKTVADISCDASGFITLITHHSAWHTFQLSSNGSSIDMTPVNDVLQLTSLTHTKNAFRSELSLLSLGSFHVLLAGVTSATRDIVLLTWDMQYSVLLASHTFARPSSLNRESALDLTLVGATSTQAVLILSPPKTESKGRSHVLAVPYTVPASSTIANAIGRGSAGAQWIAPSSSKDVSVDWEPGQEKLLNTIRNALASKQIQAASDTFFQWQKKDVERKRSEAAKRDWSEPARNSYGYEFTKAIIDMWVPTLKQPEPGYLPDVAKHLLQTGSVRANMVRGGKLLGLFKTRNDWANILLALEHVPDLTESDIIATLHAVIVHQLTEKDAMQVDSASDFPKLEHFLSLVICYPCTPAALRLAIRQNLREAHETLIVLQVLEGWINSDDENDQTPPLDQTLAFARSLLDSSFLSLVQHTPAHPVLRRISEALVPELELSRDLERLRLPLEPFARAQRDRAQGKKPDGELTKRQRKIREQNQSAVAIGLYRLEELSL